MAGAAAEMADDTAPTAPEAPPEPASAVWTRRFVIVAFWAVVVCLGLPHWTWTTSIHRSDLPIEVMNSWAGGQACQFRYPLQIALVANDLTDAQRGFLTSQLQQTLNQQQESLHVFRVTADAAAANTAALTIHLDNTNAKAEPTSKLRSWSPVLDVNYGLTPQDSPESLLTYLSQEISSVFADESASLAYLLQDSPFGHPGSLVPAGDARAKLEGRTTRAFKYASTYHLTFSLFTPSGSPSAWDVDEALNQSISQLILPLSKISNFTVDTQVQLYASFSPSITGPVYDEASKKWILHHDDLTGFVNAAEWPLSPSIGSGPTINFVLYVPDPSKSPLSIGGSGGTSWIIPQWGGVQIHNTAGAGSDRLTAADLEEDMLVFADQLTSLLGMPQSPSSLALRISSLARERTTSLIISASSTLGALARLTLKLTSIAIPDSVAQSVDETISRLDLACQSLNDGRFEDALAHARIAESEAEKAFFEPSMVGQVYFPEEHKVAVYVPLLGPMAVPMIMSAIKELRGLRRSKVKTA